ncbi:hypothetical protein ACOME3_005950 [Neoechinorhynchus agilis]
MTLNNPEDSTKGCEEIFEKSLHLISDNAGLQKIEKHELKPLGWTPDEEFMKNLEKQRKVSDTFVALVNYQIKKEKLRLSSFNNDSSRSKREESSVDKRISKPLKLVLSLMGIASKHSNLESPFDSMKYGNQQETTKIIESRIRSIEGNQSKEDLLVSKKAPRTTETNAKFFENCGQDAIHEEGKREAQKQSWTSNQDNHECDSFKSKRTSKASKLLRAVKQLKIQESTTGILHSCPQDAIQTKGKQRVQKQIRTSNQDNHERDSFKGKRTSKASRLLRAVKQREIKELNANIVQSCPQYAIHEEGKQRVQMQIRTSNQDNHERDSFKGKRTSKASRLLRAVKQREIKELNASIFQSCPQDAIQTKGTQRVQTQSWKSNHDNNDRYLFKGKIMSEAWRLVRAVKQLKIQESTTGILHSCPQDAIQTKGKQRVQKQIRTSNQDNHERDSFKGKRTSKASRLLRAVKQREIKELNASIFQSCPQDAIQTKGTQRVQTQSWKSNHDNNDRYLFKGKIMSEASRLLRAVKQREIKELNASIFQSCPQDAIQTKGTQRVQTQSWKSNHDNNDRYLFKGKIMSEAWRLVRAVKQLEIQELNANIFQSCPQDAIQTKGKQRVQTQSWKSNHDNNDRYLFKGKIMSEAWRLVRAVKPLEIQELNANIFQSCPQDAIQTKGKQRVQKQIWTSNQDNHERDSFKGKRTSKASRLLRAVKQLEIQKSNANIVQSCPQNAIHEEGKQRVQKQSWTSNQDNHERLSFKGKGTSKASRLLRTVKQLEIQQLNTNIFENCPQDAIQTKGKQRVQTQSWKSNHDNNERYLFKGKIMSEASRLLRAVKQLEIQELNANSFQGCPQDAIQTKRKRKVQTQSWKSNHDNNERDSFKIKRTSKASRLLRAVKQLELP